MSSSSWLRVAKAAMAGAIGSAGIVASAVALLRAEARHARRVIPAPELDDLPDPSGTYGKEYQTDSQRPLEMLVLGDSLAVGYRVRADETLVAHLAASTAREAKRPVRLSTAAKVGARSADLQAQLDAGSEHCPDPDLGVIIVGANDLTSNQPRASSLWCLTATTRMLRAQGSEVVVGTCPDLGSVEPIKQPLRAMAARQSRQYAAEQAAALRPEGARVAPLGEALRDDFRNNPERNFGADRYHPSARGYALGARAMMPAVREALGLEPAAAASDQLGASRSRGRSRGGKLASRTADAGRGGPRRGVDRRGGSVDAPERGS